MPPAAVVPPVALPAVARPLVAPPGPVAPDGPTPPAPPGPVPAPSAPAWPPGAWPLLPIVDRAWSLPPDPRATGTRAAMRTAKTTAAATPAAVRSLAGPSRSQSLNSRNGGTRASSALGCHVRAGDHVLVS